jgi:hypothetical protein
VPGKHVETVKAVMGRLLVNGKVPLAGGNIQAELWADNEWRYQTEELALALLRT